MIAPIFRRILALLMLSILIAGCATMRQGQPIADNESIDDVNQAVESVAEAIAGKELTEEEVENLKKQIRSDEEAQSAIRNISESLDSKNIQVKFCPKTGKRYSAHIERCPTHKILLENVE